MESIGGNFESLMARAVTELGISEERISKMNSVTKIQRDGHNWFYNHKEIVAISLLILFIAASPVVLYRSAQNGSDLTFSLFDQYYSLMYQSTALDESCLVESVEVIQDPFRPPVNCSECAGVTGVHRVVELSHEDFLEKYAFSMQPVLIKDGQNGWTAKDTFTFDFFRNVYSEGSGALDKVNNECQFFPYSTEFKNLGEMLNMSKDRVEGKEKPWYVGWSNCDGKAANILRKHYEFPYFLPPELDHSKTDWVFMGLPGYGAHMHIDAVGALSWQAQVKGIKKWILEVPPECAGTCISRMEILVEPGDIIVLDTNKWYHGTLILGNETSIVIGSEYY